MNPEYGDIFRQRGHPYHAAMQAFPDARGAEFEALFAASPLRDGERILDLPAGGGYLARRLGARARVTSVEITHGFHPAIPIVDPGDLSMLHGHDRATCVAALHHFEDAPAFLARLGRTVAPGGLLHIADVAAGSPLCAFLDGFVGRYNTTGHAGRYLPTEPAHYAPLGRVLRCAEVGCPWRFAHEAGLLAFCGTLFGLVDCPPAELREALQRQVGIRATQAGVELDWRLLYVDIAID